VSEFLISGATGQLGSAVVRATAGRSAVFVARRRNAASAAARVRGLVPDVALDPTAVIEGDVSADRWGSVGSDERLDDVRVIMNLAASTDWAAPWSELYRANAIAPVQALRLAGDIAKRSGRDVTVVHIGSALGVHTEDRWVPERRLSLSAHATDYERSKWLGEEQFLAGRAPEGVRRVLVRATGIIGSAERTPLARRHGPYLYLQMAAASGLNVLPCNPTGRVDMVPSDVAARVLLAVVNERQRIADGTICHLSLGETAPTIATVIQVLNDARAREGAPRFRIVPITARLATRGADAVDRLVPLGRRRRNLLIGLRYFSIDRFFSRENLTAIVEPDRLPMLDLNLLPDMLVQRRAQPALRAAVGVGGGPFELFDG
jgi:nucleoside-diphosphate-sugar epimerase